MEGEGDLVLEINEESLHNKLLEHKNHIGFNCAEGSLIIASGLAFVYTIVSGKINNNILNIVSWCFAIGQIIYCKFRFIGSPIPLATDQCFRL